MNLHYVNPKEVDLFDTEQVRKILHAYNSSWYNTADKLSLSFSIYIIFQWSRRNKHINNSSGLI